MGELKRLTETELLMLLRAEREQMLRARTPSPIPVSNTKWIVGGVVAVFLMLVSFCWSMFTVSMEMMERQADRSHELAAAAVKAPKVVVASSGAPGEVYVLIGVAVFFIVLGAIGKVVK